MLAESFLNVDFDKETLDNCVSTYHSSRSFLESLAPKAEKMIKARPKQPWFNCELRQLKQKKRREKRKLRKHPNKMNLSEYGKLKNICYLAIKSSRIRYHAQILSRYEKNNPKALYQCVQNLSGDSAPKIFPSSFSHADLADEFAEYFENKISMIRSGFYAHHHQDDDLSKDTFSACEAEDIGSLHTTNYMSEFNSITGEDINYILSKLNNKNYMTLPH